MRTGARDLHSGLYGGAVLNATHVLMAMLARGAARTPDGRVRDGAARRRGAARRTPSASRGQRLPSGAEMIAEARRASRSRRARRDEFWERTGAEPARRREHARGRRAAHDRSRRWRAAHAERAAGARARARRRSRAELERLLRGGRAGRAPRCRSSSTSPSRRCSTRRDPALQLAAGAFERACGTAPAFVRLGGTLPLLVGAGRAAASPTIVSGFALGADAFHAPNESYRLESLRLGEATARELYAALADLPPAEQTGRAEASATRAA